MRTGGTVRVAAVSSNLVPALPADLGGSAFWCRRVTVRGVSLGESACRADTPHEGQWWQHWAACSQREARSTGNTKVRE